MKTQTWISGFHATISNPVYTAKLTVDLNLAMLAVEENLSPTKTKPLSRLLNQKRIKCRFPTHL